MAVYQSGLSTERHDRIDVETYYKRVYQAVCSRQNPRVADAFAGGGRDIAALRSKLNGAGAFIAIDSDPLRIKDMIAKNNGSDPAPFVCVQTRAGLCDVMKRGEIAVIQGEFPDQPYGRSDIDLRGSVNFTLCNAGIMFVHPAKLEPTLRVLADMLASGGELCLRFSQTRDDKKKETGKTYFVHEPEIVREILEGQGLKTARHPDLPDPDRRPFAWIDIEARKPRLTESRP